MNVLVLKKFISNLEDFLFSMQGIHIYFALANKFFFSIPRSHLSEASAASDTMVAALASKCQLFVMDRANCTYLQGKLGQIPKNLQNIKLPALNTTALLPTFNELVRTGHFQPTARAMWAYLASSGPLNDYATSLFVDDEVFLSCFADGKY